MGPEAQDAATNNDEEDEEDELLRALVDDVD